MERAHIERSFADIFEITSRVNRRVAAGFIIISPIERRRSPFHLKAFGDMIIYISR
jgi:hypothetical protein